MRTETLNVETSNGATTAYVAFPNDRSSQCVFVIHEWWGLNENIKDICGRYAAEGFVAVAPDLYLGKVAKDADEASAMMNSLAIEDGIDTIKSTLAKAAEMYGFSHFGITGFCMGGTYSLRAACELEGISAAVPFYGDIPDENILSKLRTPTIFISGTHDAWIDPKKVAGLEDVAERFELPVQSVKYDADHAFFNNTRPEVYNETAASDAWARAVAFFKENL